MKDSIKQITEKTVARISAADSLKAIEEIKISVFGKKGELTEILKGMGRLSEEERPAMGRIVNEARLFMEEKMEEARAAFAKRELDERLNAERIDVTIPGRKNALGGRHPMSSIIEELCDIFVGMGYEIAEGPEIETEYYNFVALNTPENHPSRDLQDTFYMAGDGGFVLRTHTSPVQIRAMERMKPPIRIICPGKVYRSDEADATHTPVFHQMEGLVVDKGVTLGDLKGALTVFVRELFGSDAKIRFRPHYFPFTEPSGEVDVSCFSCGGGGCRVCKGDGWIELLGCGMVHPKVLEMSGIDPSVYSGFAFGMGLERTAMQRYGIPSIRLLFENDVRFLKQFV